MRGYAIGVIHFAIVAAYLRWHDVHLHATAQHCEVDRRHITKALGRSRLSNARVKRVNAGATVSPSQAHAPVRGEVSS